MKTIKSTIRNTLDTFFIILARLTRTNLTIVGYYQKGILRHGNDEVTGEKFVIENILKNLIKKRNPIFFDVGANIGLYSVALKKQFVDCEIYAFEPNPRSFEKIDSSALNQAIKFNNIGLGSDSSSRQTLYDYKERGGTEHASIYKEVLTDIHKSNDIEEMVFTNKTLDDFCIENNIKHLDFLKIDTEGSEFDVLIGSKKMLSENNIDIIQFEFNEMNVVSKVFLKNFYDILTNFNIYRINQDKLIPLLEYKTENEIFKYQNFLAINKKLI